ncbi:glycyl-radical enzyme activating protein [Clostridium novyi]
MEGIVFDIQRFSVHDGPGIRSLVFLKGCPLSCLWCSNPESQKPNPQVMFISRNCIQCGNCARACKVGAIDVINRNGIDKNKCINCGKCVETCYANALNMAGTSKKVEEIIEVLRKDNSYYRRSGGGITLSGGEPLYQGDFAIELLKACKDKGWHTAVETTAFVNREVLKRALKYLDLVMVDVKSMDSIKHKKYTGQGNEIILGNIKFISEFGVPIVIRVPVIPGVNDDEENIRNTAKFAMSLNGVKEVNLLPYHRLGENKYDYLGYEYKMKDLEVPGDDNINKLKSIVEQYGLNCKIGG